MWIWIRNECQNLFKNGSVQRKTHIYLGTEQNHDTEHKDEKEKLKKEYLRRWRLVLDAKLNTIKYKQLDQWQYQFSGIVLEFLTGAKKNCKNWAGNC